MSWTFLPGKCYLPNAYSSFPISLLRYQFALHCLFLTPSLLIGVAFTKLYFVINIRSGTHAHIIVVVVRSQNSSFRVYIVCVCTQRVSARDACGLASAAQDMPMVG